jgi:predicted SPOUT superfamily RNA methylase MTH1
MSLEGDRARAPPPRPVVKRCVAIPASIFVGEDRRLATLRLGLLARYISIFRVEEVVVFGKGDELVVEVLRYAETPPYLRRRLIPLRPALRYAGVVPPLQSPHHPPSPRGRGFSCEYREGVVLSSAGSYSLVDVGLREPVVAEGVGRVGERVTVRLGDRPRIVSRSEVPYYWGYRVVHVPDLRGALKLCERYLKVGTSRLGLPLKEVAGELASKARERGCVALFFGEREKGLFDLAAEEGLNAAEEFDYIVNIAPRQGSFTIRTEEAVPIALALLDFILAD